MQGLLKKEIHIFLVKMQTPLNVVPLNPGHSHRSIAKSPKIAQNGRYLKNNVAGWVHLSNNSLWRGYASFKFNQTSRIELYVFTMRERKHKLELTRIRCAGLMCQAKYTGVKETYCPLCKNQVSANEYHYSLVCE